MDPPDRCQDGFGRQLTSSWSASEESRAARNGTRRRERVVIIHPVPFSGRSRWVWAPAYVLLVGLRRKPCSQERYSEKGKSHNNSPCPLFRSTDCRQQRPVH